MFIMDTFGYNDLVLVAPLSALCCFFAAGGSPAAVMKCLIRVTLTLCAAFHSVRIYNVVPKSFPSSFYRSISKFHLHTIVEFRI